MEKLVLLIYFTSFLFYLIYNFKRARPLEIVARSLLVAGFCLNAFSIWRHWVLLERPVLTNTSETMLFLASVITLAFLIFNSFNREIRTLGLFVSFIVSLCVVFSIFIFKRKAMPLLPALQSRWLVFHVSACIIAYANFTIAFIASVIYLVKKSGKDILARIAHRAICIGLLSLTIGIILGSMWGKSAWGHWWNWDPKEVWALITWLIYMAYVHLRLLKTWPETKLSWLAILGFLAVIFTYLGVNFLMKGLHSYA